MRSAKIGNGVVENVAVGLPPGFVECPDWVTRGDLYDGEDFMHAPAPALSIGAVLAQRLDDVRALYNGKMDIGYLWSECPGGPQTVETDEGTKAAMTHFALRAKRSVDQAQTKTFKWRFAGPIIIELSDVEFLNLAESMFDWAVTIDESAQIHKFALYAIFGTINSESNQSEIGLAISDLSNHNITANW